MKSLLIIAAVLFAGALALESGQVCEPGTNFMVDCNTCRCSADGKLVSCTRKFCLPEEQGDDPKAQAVEESSNGNEKEEEQVHTNGQVCTPNEVKMEDCNRCKCAANGIGWFCTRRVCPPREKREVAAPNRKPMCMPENFFWSTDYCNDYFYTETGITACMRKLCNLRAKRESAPLEKECEPGSTFLHPDGCNQCFCTKDGRGACTLKLCLNSEKRRSVRAAGDADLPRSEIAPWANGFSCAPNKAFKYQCNTCRCDDSGSRAACTLKFCIEGEY
ncbi:uncharacterized protein LOC129769814 [Toxorhynchites rutilus septentrionalis]|uniref:uncharacterized protein LOC129769814 n=1 Tax=Toxorhynchites rutilus septentrionalis TaxID=329112 RepID=UPI00247AF5D3|nr:uncharacterized protein LOC129769814 [Toxorhynchites rutilus septentrionalis]